MCMKKLFALLMICCLLCSAALAENASAASVRVTLTVGDKVIPAVLNDNEAARSLLSRLPCTVTVSRGSVDFCGDMGEPLDYSEEDEQDGFEYGDFMWMPDGNWFVFFTDDIETYSRQHPWIVLGHMDESWEVLRKMEGTIDMTIARADMGMRIGDTYVTVEWEENESVAALRKLTEEKPLSISMSMYGGFEQVGSIGQSLPREDRQTTTQSGDIVLYSGDQIVVFYGSNSWAYTPLGHISDKSAQEMAELLSNGNVTIQIGYGI